MLKLVKECRCGVKVRHHALKNEIVHEQFHKMLWQHLHDECETILFTNRLSEDCSKHLFNMIKEKEGIEIVLTTQQFWVAFRQTVLKKLVVQLDVSNCRDNLERILLDLTNFTSRSTSGPIKREEERF